MSKRGRRTGEPSLPPSRALSPDRTLSPSLAPPPLSDLTQPTPHRPNRTRSGNEKDTPPARPFATHDRFLLVSYIHN
ncbi:hypothetical protein AAC387_Pa03g3664 [Persea americana]